MNLFYIILVAISLSMDTFSLSLSIGTLFSNIKKMVLLSLTVGIFHFIMPLIGSSIGSSFINLFHINTHLLSGLIFMYIAIDMFREYKNKEEKSFIMNLSNIIVFSLGVSLDSFGVGFTLNTEFAINLIYSFIFALFAFSFTFLGLKLGDILKQKVGSYAILLGASLMSILALTNILNILF